jgi:hypothetical protein
MRGMNELIKSAGDMVIGDGAGDVLSVLADAGGFMLKEGGKIAIGILVRPTIEDLLSKFRKAQADGEIPEDFEKTPHGAALLQEALNALLDGLDQERADAVLKVFIGLAKNPVEDSVGRLEQLDIMRIASELTAWEVFSINVLERYQKLVFSEDYAASWKGTHTPEQRQGVKQQAVGHGPNFEKWLMDTICSNEKSRFLNVRDAITSLSTKRIVADVTNGLTELGRTCVYMERGAFTPFGLKLVIHLYSAKAD